MKTVQEEEAVARQQISSEELYTQVRRLVAEEYGVDIELVKPNSDLDDNLGGRGNNIDIWEFIWSLEVRYKIDIPMGEVGTVKELADYIKKHQIKSRHA
jgi:acyl carrier protein